MSRPFPTQYCHVLCSLGGLLSTWTWLLWTCHLIHLSYTGRLDCFLCIQLRYKFPENLHLPKTQISMRADKQLPVGAVCWASEGQGCLLRQEHHPGSVPLLFQRTHGPQAKGGFCSKRGSLVQDALQQASAKGSSLDVPGVLCSSRA